MRRFLKVVFVAGVGASLLIWYVAQVTKARVRESPTLIEANRHKILLLTVGTEPGSLDPQVARGIPERQIMEALFEGLVIPDPKDSSKQIPGVAQSWEHNEDYSAWTFHLRPEAKWSNGDSLTADDFLFSIKRALTASLGAPFADLFFVIKGAREYLRGEIHDLNQVGVKVVDPRTLHYELVGPDPYFTALITHHAFFPVHPPTILKFGTIGQRDTSWTRPGNLVSNGPFVLKTWRKNDVIEVVKSLTYWDAGFVKLHGIHFYSIEDLNTEDRAFRAGQLHLTASVPLDKVPYYRREAPGLLRIAPYLGVYYYVLNVMEKPLDDPRVRLALSLALDRESLVRNILRANQQPATGIIPPGISNYSVAHRLGYDPDRARQLLAEAGYPGGYGFPALHIFINTLEAHRTIAEAIQQMWKDELNIDVGIENQEWKVYLETLSKRHFDIGRLGWIGDTYPESFLRIWKTESPNNFAGWNNPKYDDLLARVDRTGDLPQRVDLAHQAEDLLLNESPVIPIYWYSSLHLVHPSVTGWYSNVLDDHPYKFVDLEPLEDLQGLKLSRNP